MVEGMPNCNLYFDFYEHCLYGKTNRVKFPSSATREEEILELIHNDVFGPIPIPSLGGSMYYVRFIDDFSRNTWLYFLKKIKGFQEIQGVQGSSGKPNRKEHKGDENCQWRFIL